MVALDLFPPSSGFNPSHKIFHTEIQYLLANYKLSNYLSQLNYVFGLYDVLFDYFEGTENQKI